MADSQAFTANAGFSISNFAVLVGGAIVGGVLAWKMFNNGDTHLKSMSALTNQDYIEDEMYQTMRASAAYPSTVEENRDRILDLIRRHHVDVRNLVEKLRKKEITPQQYRTQIRALAQVLSTQLHIGHGGGDSEVNRARRKAECEAAITKVITRISGTNMPQIQKDKLVARLSARKAHC